MQEQLFAAAGNGDLARLAELLDRHPELLLARNEPYEWTLLHVAAHRGHLAAVDLLLRRGIDANVREKGDNTYPMHWAAAAGRTDVVRRLIEAGGDVVGTGDDHELEVIGWATCWDGCDDAAHRAVVQLLLAQGAHHHIFSAVAMDLEAEVRRIVAADPAQLHRRMSRNEDHQLPLHFAVRMARPAMVRLLLELGADPLGNDATGYPAPAYATDAGVDLPILERILALTAAELQSADRGNRPARVELVDILAAVALARWATAERLLQEAGEAALQGGRSAGVLHLASKRGDATGVRWLLDHGVDPSARWLHWDALVTPLHLAVLGDHLEVVRLLLGAGADPAIRDSKHDSDALGWAEFFGRADMVRLLEPHRAS